MSKMSTSLAQNKTMVKLVLGFWDLTLNEDVKLFTHHLLLGLSDNTTLTNLSLTLPKQCWDWLQEGEECGSFKENNCDRISNSSKLILCKLFESLHCCILFAKFSVYTNNQTSHISRHTVLCSFNYVYFWSTEHSLNNMGVLSKSH